MPPGQRRYEVQLSSKSGPIDVFLIQDPAACSTTNSSENLMSNTVMNDYSFPRCRNVEAF